MNLFARLLAVASLTCAATSAAYAAAPYPSHPIRLILSTSPGGGADVTMRLLAPKMAQILGQNIIIENKPGASGMIADSFVARSAPDGYTLLVDITTFTVNPALHKDMDFKPLKDLAPVTLTVRAANVLVVNPKLPVHNLKEFVSYVKQQDGAMSFASSGIGSSQHLAMEIFLQDIHGHMTHVPYKGGGAAMADLLAGHVPTAFAFIPTATDYIAQGQLRALATSGQARSPSLPNVPTVAESGYPGFESYDWNGMFAPAKTPESVVKKIQLAVKQALADPDVQTHLKALGLEPVGSTPAEFRTFLASEIKQDQNIVDKAHITLQ